MENFKLKISIWINGVLKTITKFFRNLQEAIEESKLWKGIVKIYNNLNQLLFSNKNNTDDCYA